MSDEQTPQDQNEQASNTAPDAQTPEDAAEQPASTDDAAAAEQTPDAADPGASSAEAGGEAEEESAAAESADQAEAPANDVEAAMQAMLDGASDEGESGPVSADEVEAAMQAMLDGADGGQGGEGTLPPGAQPFEPPDLSAESASGETSQIDMLDDVELDVKIELGRTEMYIEDVLGLGPGSVVELDKAAGDPVDIYVNERLVARGEVLVLNDSFCVRINDIVSPVPELEDGR